MMNNRAFYPVVIFVGLLIAAIMVGNFLLTAVSGRPLEQIPNIFKFIVHGISLTIIALVAKKYFGG